MAKLIHADLATNFETKFKEWSTPGFNSIAFTDDGYLYTHGKKFALNVVSGDTLTSFALNIAGRKLTLTNNGYTTSTNLPIIGVTQGTSITITETSSGSANYKISHTEQSGLKQTSLGSVSGQATQPQVLKTVSLSLDKCGHITAASEVTTTVNHVLQTTGTATSYILGSTSNGTGTRATQINTGVYITNNDTLNTPNLKISNSDVTPQLTNTNEHASKAGFVKLSDATNASLNTTQGTAATPKAVHDALLEAKNHANGLLSANDAMVFKGTFGSDGLISSVGTLKGKAITQITNYSAGWVFRYNPTVSSTVFNFNGQNLEAGDMIIAVADYKTSYLASDWTVLQTNIDGAVTAVNVLNGIVISKKDGRAVESFAFPTDTTNKFLTCKGSTLAWQTVQDNNSWRPVQVNSSTLLGSSVTSGVLNLTAGKGMTISGSGSAVTFNTNLNTLTLGTLEYNGLTGGQKVSFTNGLTSSLSPDKLTLTVSHTIPSSFTKISTATPKKIKTDEYGHIIAYEAVDALDIQINGTSAAKYDGTTNKIINFVGKSNGDTSIAVSHDISNNQITLTPTITHKYKPIQFFNKAGSIVVNSPNSDASTIQIKAGNNVEILGSGKTATISATNTWRNVSAWTASSASAIEVLQQNSVGTADLAFNGDFLWTSTVNNNDGEIGIAWAEVTAEGITYSV